MLAVCAVILPPAWIPRVSHHDHDDDDHYHYHYYYVFSYLSSAAVLNLSAKPYDKIYFVSSNLTFVICLGMWRSQEKFAFVECEFHKTNPFECKCEWEFNHTLTCLWQKMKKVVQKKSESKYVSALPKILNGSSLLTWRSAMSSTIFSHFRLLGNAHVPVAGGRRHVVPIV